MLTAALALGVLPASAADGATSALPAPGVAARPGGHCPDGPPCGYGHGGGPSTPDVPDVPDQPRVPDVPDVPGTPDPPPSGTVGQVAVAHANIPMRSGAAGFARGMRQLLAPRPDFVTLNEQFGRSLASITAVATGYDAFRVDRVPKGPGSREALGNVVLWNAGDWRFVDGGRIRLVDDDRSRFGGRIVVWDRYATWATLRSRTSGEVVSVVAAHHMTNPAKYGPAKAKRKRAYRVGMNRLVRLADRLDAQGPVVVGGDFNVHAGQRESWTAVTRMARAGYAWQSSKVDYLFYPAAKGVQLMRGCTLTHRTRVSDHPFLVGLFALNRTGARQRASLSC